MLSVRHLQKRYGERSAVDDVSFRVRPGAITALLGRNGAGKTTTLRMITGILLPDAGEVEILGSKAGAASLRDRIGYLPEERGLYGHMRVYENLLFFAALKGRPRRWVREPAERWLRRLELWDMRDRKLAELSKGNQQKVQLICALLHEPGLVVLDEPMSGLDPVNASMVRDILRELRAANRTILVSTHALALAETMADEIVMIDRGRVACAGTPDEVRQSSSRGQIAILELDGDGRFLENLPGVAAATFRGSTAELLLEAGADAQSILAAAVGRVTVRSFGLVVPSLEEVFVAHVGRGAPTRAVESEGDA